MDDPALPEHDRSAWNAVLNEVQSIIIDFREKTLTGDIPDGLMFRGQKKADWPLLPSIYRSPDALENEGNLFNIFDRKARPHLTHAAKDWELLAHMQHFGVPTRLLDWSDSFGVALYFAISNQELYQPEDAAVWIMNGFKLNKLVGYDGFIFSLDDFPSYEQHYATPLFANYPAPVVDPKPWPFATPVAVEAAWAHSRLMAQRGMFTVHGTAPDPLERQVSDQFLRRVVIPKTAILHARQWLRLAGIDHYTIFPDLEALAQTIKDEYCDNNMKIYQRISVLD